MSEEFDIKELVEIELALNWRINYFPEIAYTHNLIALRDKVKSKQIKGIEHLL